MRCALAWIFYWLGDGVSRVMALRDKLGGPLYPLYNWLMTTSSRIQGKTDHGPWENVQSPRS